MTDKNEKGAGDPNVSKVSQVTEEPEVVDVMVEELRVRVEFSDGSGALYLRVNDNDRTWNIVRLSKGDIEIVARSKLGLDARVFDQGELDMIARNYQRGIEALLGAPYDWTDILAESIKIALESMDADDLGHRMVELGVSL